jgi:hypothetical protein
VLAVARASGVGDRLNERYQIRSALTSYAGGSEWAVSTGRRGGAELQPLVGWAALGPSAGRTASAPGEGPFSVEEALARSLLLAAAAQRWDVVAQLARELEARRLDSSGVTRLDAAKRRT